MLNEKYAQNNKFEIGNYFSTKDFVRYYYAKNYTYIGSFEAFPLLPLPRTMYISQNFVSFNLVANRELIKDIDNRLDYETSISYNSIKLLKSINNCFIPLIKAKLKQFDLKAISFDDINLIRRANINSLMFDFLYLIAGLSVLTLIVISSYTAREIYQDRTMVIESFYRVGAVRKQIIRAFTIEFLLIIILPLILTIFTSFTLIPTIATRLINVESFYTSFKIAIPFWLLISTLIGGILFSLFGWLPILITQIYRYQPVKQE
ncbi:MAG TPA: hypothetical protein VMZ29_16630 [Candidatus Bathyarchaeia archaeon]|nr:hypothetical protein [Candidatus Bathyarchaeia archaeon]